jgi:hypothetical protein
VPDVVSDLLRHLLPCCRSWFAPEWRLKVKQWNGEDAVPERIYHA